MSDLPELPEIDQRGAPAGWQWVWWACAGYWWRVVPEDESRPCRAEPIEPAPVGAGSALRMCGRPSVAAMVRVDEVPWHYCADCLHRSGLSIVDGVIYEQRLEPR